MVGAIGLGCMSFGGMYGPTDEATSHRALAKAWDLGMTHLDTANVYGPKTSEEAIGSFLKKHRHRFHIATKVGITRKPEKPQDNSADYIRGEIEGSLTRLGVDHIDLYYIHRREQARPIEEVMETLVKLKDEGKIGAIGLSEISPATLERASAIHPVAAVQSEYSLWTRLPELGIIQACERLGTTLVAFSPLARGFFSDTPLDRDAFPEGDFRRSNPRFNGENYEYNNRRITHFVEYAHARGWSAAALAVAWTLARAEHIIPIPGTRSPEHLEQFAAAAEMMLTPKDLAEIEEILPVGFAHGERYSGAQTNGPEGYC